ncbi:MAG: hypothetical protein ABIJ09_05515 [Pseudomonadota bacterium]
MNSRMSRSRGLGPWGAVVLALCLGPARAAAQEAGSQPGEDPPTSQAAQMPAGETPADTQEPVIGDPAASAEEVQPEVAVDPQTEPTPASPAEASPVETRQVEVELREVQAAPALDGVQLATVSFLAGALSSVVVVPAALVAGSVLGSLPQSLVLAALPPLLVAGLVPPLVVAGAEWLLQDWLVANPGSFWVAWGSTTLVHIGALVGGGLLNVSTTDLPSLATLVAAEGLLLPLTATTALALTRAEGSHVE